MVTGIAQQRLQSFIAELIKRKNHMNRKEKSVKTILIFEQEKS